MPPHLSRAHSWTMAVVACHPSRCLLWLCQHMEARTRAQGRGRSISSRCVWLLLLLAELGNLATSFLTIQLLHSRVLAFPAYNLGSVHCCDLLDP